MIQLAFSIRAAKPLRRGVWADGVRIAPPLVECFDSVWPAQILAKIDPVNTQRLASADCLAVFKSKSIRKTRAFLFA